MTFCLTCKGCKYFPLTRLHPLYIKQCVCERAKGRLGPTKTASRSHAQDWPCYVHAEKDRERKGEEREGGGGEINGLIERKENNKVRQDKKQKKSFETSLSSDATTTVVLSASYECS